MHVTHKILKEALPQITVKIRTVDGAEHIHTNNQTIFNYKPDYKWMMNNRFTEHFSDNSLGHPYDISSADELFINGVQCMEKIKTDDDIWLNKAAIMSYELIETKYEKDLKILRTDIHSNWNSNSRIKRINFELLDDIEGFN